MFDNRRREEGSRRREHRRFRLREENVVVRTVLSTWQLIVAVVFGIKLPRLACTESVGLNSALTGLATTALKEWPSIFLE